MPIGKPNVGRLDISGGVPLRMLAWLLTTIEVAKRDSVSQRWQIVATCVQFIRLGHLICICLLSAGFQLVSGPHDHVVRKSFRPHVWLLFGLRSVCLAHVWLVTCLLLTIWSTVCSEPRNKSENLLNLLAMCFFNANGLIHLCLISFSGRVSVGPHVQQPAKEVRRLCTVSLRRLLVGVRPRALPALLSQQAPKCAWNSLYELE